MEELSLEKTHKVLIFEPNQKLLTPYSYISKEFLITRKETLDAGENELECNDISYIFLSASFPAHESLAFLSTASIADTKRIIPVVIVVDWNNALNFVPGMKWGGKMSILTSTSTKREYYFAMGKM